MITADVDVSQLGFLLNGIRHALIGTGHNGDLTELTKDETRLLAVELSNQVGPSALAKGEAKVQKDVNHFLVAPYENLIGGQRDGDGITWISAGPKFLTGVRNVDYFRETANQGMITFLYRQAKEQDRGTKYVSLGKRGAQHVQLINRTVVSRGAREALALELATHVGRQKASFMETAISLGHKGVPQWVRRHIPSPKAINDQSGLSNAESPSITFGSSSRGISKMGDRVKRAVRNRAAKMKKKLEGILFGYAQDVRSRKHPRKHFHASP